MQKEDYTENNIRYVRINKRKARIKFVEGKTIYLIQDNMRLGNAWQGLCPISNERYSAIGNTFDNHVTDFMYYNCDSERGRGVKYFIDENDLNNSYSRLAKKIDQLYLECCSKQKRDPNFVDCVIRWNDDKENLVDVKIALFTDYQPEIDDSIFFYCNGLGEFKSLIENGCNEFVVVDCIQFNI